MSKLIKCCQFLMRILTLKLKYGQSISMSNSVRLEKLVDIVAVNGGKIELSNAIISRNSHIASVGGYVKFGEDIFLNANVRVVCHQRIEIGSGCKFGPNVCVYDHDHSFGEFGVGDDYKTSPIIIGENCWIGANAIILRGAVIGRNSVIGAGVIVKGIIPAHSILKSKQNYTVERIRY